MDIPHCNDLACAPIHAALTDRDVFVVAMQMGLKIGDWHGLVFASKDAFATLVSLLQEGQTPNTFQELLGYLMDDEQWLGETLVIEHKLVPVASFVRLAPEDARAAASRFARHVLRLTVA